MRIELADSPATEMLGQVLAATRPARAVVHLHAQCAQQGAIRSPTYTLVERYPVPGGEAWHLDLYRIGNASELDFLGLDGDEASLWLVEWPERGAGALPPADLRVWLQQQGPGRRAELEADSAAGQAWLAAVQETGRLRALPAGGP